MESKEEAAVVERLSQYVTHYHDSIELSDARELIAGFRTFLERNPIKTTDETQRAIERAEKAEAELAVWPQRASNLLDVVEKPASIPEGAPGSLHRRAWDLGRSLRLAQPIPPARVIEENVADKPTAQIVGYDVFSWRPGPAGSGGKCTEVHLVLPIHPEVRVALCLKSPRALDELVGVLLQHRKDVWP